MSSTSAARALCASEASQFGSKSYRHNFAHELMIAQITASIELGTRENSAVRLIRWREILANENTPAALRDAANPTAIGVSYALRGQSRTEQVIADAQPFGLERLIDGKRSYLFFPGIEADCGTEPIDASDPERASIGKKFCAYLAVAEQGLHRSHFGFPNFFVPFITTSSARMRSMMELLDAAHRRTRIEDSAVQDLSELHCGREAAGAERPHAHRAVAAGRLSPAQSRSLTCHGPASENHRAE